MCKVLEIDPTATRRLDDDEKAALRLTQGESNRTSDTTIVNEPGLYTFVLGQSDSDKDTKGKSRLSPPSDHPKKANPPKPPP